MSKPDGEGIMTQVINKDELPYGSIAHKSRDTATAM